MPTPESLLLAGLRAAPRRYRLPPLPAHAAAARADGAPAAVAFALEALRVAQERAAPPHAEAQEAFVAGLDALIRDALSPRHGDPAYQAMVLRSLDAEVGDYATLLAQAGADRRAVRGMVDAVAHPGRLRGRAAEAPDERLAPLHALAAAGEWAALRHAVERARAGAAAGEGPAADALQRLRAEPALARLERGQVLRDSPGVLRYRRLLEQAGPAAGSPEAAVSGRVAAQRGGRAETDVADVLRRIAGRLGDAAAGRAAYRVARSLRTPPALGAASRTKAEWDAAIVAERAGAAGADIVLLAEVKASPAAATADWPRMRRGLAGLAQARGEAACTFASADGPVHVAPASLRRLQPPGHGLPEHVVYCCVADAESRPPMLSAASRAVLLVEPASLSHAGLLAAGASPPLSNLVPVWHAVAEAPRLHATRCQDRTARAAREAMLHPDDLLEAVERILGAARGS